MVRKHPRQARKIMDAGVAHEIDSVAERRFVTEADWIPGFWNYLLDLDRDDLVAELLQNDLDQDATRTVISFEEDRLVCEGNGKPVEAEGWQRLRKYLRSKSPGNKVLGYFRRRAFARQRSMRWGRSKRLVKAKFDHAWSLLAQSYRRKEIG